MNFAAEDVFLGAGFKQDEGGGSEVHVPEVLPKIDHIT